MSVKSSSFVPFLVLKYYLQSDAEDESVVAPEIVGDLEKVGTTNFKGEAAGFPALP